MFARIPFASLSRWGRTCLVLSLAGLPLFASCTTSEDTEPFVPASEGAKQPKGEGALVSEDDACAELLKAANAAYDRLGCAPTAFPKCPGFLRPGGGSGCYEYYEDSVTACVKAYGDAGSCRDLSPCLATAELNEALPSCELLIGAGGKSSVGGASGLPGGASNGGATEGGATEGGAPPAGGSPAASGAATGGQAAAGGSI
jgi:hypothetical protein